MNTKLQKKFIEDMQLRGYAQRTQTSYARAVRQLENYWHSPAEEIEEQQVRDYFLYCKNEANWSAATMRIAYSGIKFFFTVTLPMDWETIKLLKIKRLATPPTVRSIDEVRLILKTARKPQVKAFLTTVYSCGLRLSEALNLTVTDIDSERMTRIQRQLFEAGRHRGHDPYGYRSLRDGEENLVHPRQLVIVPEEAAVVRRVFRELSQRSYAEVADMLNREGLLRRGPWSRDSIKDIVRRGRVKTPPLTSVLPGITRATAVDLIRERGLELVEERFTRDEVYIADEAFLTGTAAEVTPIRELDDRRIGSGKPGDVTRDLQAAYAQITRGEIENRAEWLTFIP